jgi:hypothetical protein
VIIVLYFSIYIFLCIGIITFIIYKKIDVRTSTMAAVMALGIITQGVLYNFFGSRSYFGVYEKILSVINLSLWSSFSFSFLLSIFKKKFREIHYSNPINRFGIGTWVAGTSICAILIAKQLTEWAFIANALAGFIFFLWLIYIGICIRAFFDVYDKRLTKNAHGILLLSTVSTQSIVLLMSAVYKDVPYVIDLIFISIGLGFYLLSTFIIIKRYSTTYHSWSIEKDWNNTNCILHGALSITGLACIKSNLPGGHGIIVIWLCAAIAFLIVESLEIYRLYKRIKSLGLKKRIFVYDTSQWSRIFTFGMFYTFTFLIAPRLSVISDIQNMISTLGIWVIVILFLIELFLCFSYLYQTNRNSPNQIQRNIAEKIISSI